jgi:Ca-activated chloride channel family protein
MSETKDLSYFTFHSHSLLLISGLLILIVVWVICRSHKQKSKLSALLFRHRGAKIYCGQIKPLRLFNIQNFFIITILFLLGLATSRPTSGYQRIPKPIASNKIIYLVDISLSMVARDVPPDRLTLVKRKLTHLTQRLNSSSDMGKMGRAKVAIVVFAGQAALFTPFTEDLETIKHYLNNIDTNLMTASGSNLTASLKIAQEALQRDNLAENSTSNFLILATDGEDPDFSNPEATKLISSLNAQMIAWGVGTTQGAPIPLSDGSFLRDFRNTSGSHEMVQTKLAEDTLSNLVKSSKGLYLTINLQNNDIDQTINFITRRAKNTSLKDQNSGEDSLIPKEFGYYFLAFSLVMFVLACLFKLPEVLFLFLITCRLIIPTCHAQSPSTNTAPSTSTAPNHTTHGYEGNLAYARGDWQSSINIFEQLLKQEQNNNKYKEALANSYFMAGQHQKATELYNQLYRNSTDLKTRFRAQYNLGNSLLATNQLNGAIKAYSEALSIVPDEKRALHNLAVARKRLALTPTPTPSPSPLPTQSQPDSSSNDKNDNQQSEQNNKSNDEERQSKQNEESNTTPKDSRDKMDQTDSSKTTSKPLEDRGKGNSAPIQTPHQLPTNSPNTSDQKSELQNNQFAEPSDDAEDMSLETQNLMSAIPEAPLLIPRSNGQYVNPNGQSW